VLANKAFPLAPTFANSIVPPNRSHNKSALRACVSSSSESTPRFNLIDGAPFVTIAAVHGICFGGGFELALACDIIVADKMARFAFPELRLGLIPGFGGIPRLKRDVGNAFVRDLLLTGRSINGRARACRSLVGQLAAEGEALKIARSTAAQNHQVRRRHSRRRQKNSSSPSPTMNFAAKSIYSANSSRAQP